MRCKYTNAIIKRRFGVPQGYKEGEPLQLTGDYGSVGILIRALCSRMVTDEGVQDYVLGNLSRVGAMIGRPLNLKKNEAGDLEYDKEELKRLTDLAAPDAALLQINGGKIDFNEYVKRDKTWQAPEFDRFGQTEAEVTAQKEKMNQKRSLKRVSRVGRPTDLYRVNFFGTRVTNDKTSPTVACRISLEDLSASGFFLKAKEVRIIECEEGLKLVFHGGASINKIATKKVYGSKWKDFAPLKGEVVVVTTHKAPLAMDEYLEPDEEWLARYREDHKLPPIAPQATGDLFVDTIESISKKPKKQ